MTQPPARKIPILIASTLKPIRDIRAFGKLAFSLGETNTYELNIIGFSPKKPQPQPGIRFFSSMGNFYSRVDRILSQARFLKCLLQVRPKILVCCTYELLPLASLLKPILGFSLVYDVQENYLTNLDLNPSLSPTAKSRSSQVIRRAEAVPNVDLFLMAEKCYIKEMPGKRPFLVLENKFRGEINKVGPLNYHRKTGFQFCITGTITPSFGTWEAMAWLREILKAYPLSSLEIIGHCPLPGYGAKLAQLAKALPQVKLRLSPNPIAHEELMEALAKADFALLPYHLHPAISGKMPTKLYECAAMGIPVLVSPNSLWDDFLSSFAGGYSIDFSDPTLALGQFQSALTRTYFSSPPPESLLWKSQSAHLQKAFTKLLA
ncbi:hypothetical protein J0A67_07940 [Algoriphagus aestuariicola]|uniref:Uncharacterized protein n=1 Tax=Algoriphagus aestuariicola TaxID=1852016 RepID=A0ABS3BND9_9BACT|nr:hypothetical protein [Algoriphagus aestuariicola]MBN7800786.1 hypothetical protein [Algoriphagus aestuariicola]